MSARATQLLTPVISVPAPLSKRAKKPAAKRSREPAGHRQRVVQRDTVSAAPLCTEIGDERGHARPDFQRLRASLVAEIRETHRRRQDFHRAEKSLTLQIKAIERRLSATAELSPNTSVPTADANEEGDEVQRTNDAHTPVDDVAFFATLPLGQARAGIKKHRLSVERQLVKLAKQLPAYAFVENVHGFGALGLAQIVGEAGDLSNYANPAKLWKRMGLAVINGKSQRRVSGAGALEQGYSPVRRSIMFVIGDSLLKKQNAYKELYDARRQYEIDKAVAAGLTVRPKKKGDPKDHDPPGVRTNLCIHRRAQRYAAKRLLRDLWRAWRDQRSSDFQQVLVSPPADLPAEIRA